MSETTTTSHPLPLDVLQLPEPPGFWPFAWGWWSLLGSLLLIIITIYGIWKWQKKRNAAKKAALSLLNLERHTISPSGAMEIVRQAVLSYYPRAKVAQLSGTSWLAFLDSQVKQPIFADHVDTWLAALYEEDAEYEREQLIEHCHQWLQSALPPKRGGR
ncbi:DUF4381 domain-containing protein [Vibrio sp. HN007]|uniref:DUF4381 domain-containing protein n=1 Tax=Vibrio iocasae TaxID=3098914 RepID=UPI0035D4C279